MNIIEKTKRSGDVTLFTLFKEGLFYKCYNEDAMVFVRKVREYKVKNSFIKLMGSTVFSLGFPASEVDKGKLSFDEISEKIGARRFEPKNDSVLFYMKDLESKNGFKEWVEIQHKNELLVREPAPIYSNTNNCAHILTMIRNYDLANSTPMQGLGFIQDLKFEVHRLEKNNGNI